MEVKEHLQAKSDGDLEMAVVVKVMRVSCILADSTGGLETCQEKITRLQEANRVC